MQFINNFKKKLFSLTQNNFEQTALAAFYFQAENNPIYAEYLSYLNVDPHKVQQLRHIPFMPIEFFKTRYISSLSAEPELIFTSSGTTGAQTSRHALYDGLFYRQVARHIFRNFYGDVSTYCVLALLPAYLEREGSSLVYMVNDFIEQAQSGSGFYLNNTGELTQQLKHLHNRQVKILLIGVTFALLDLAEQIAPDLSEVIVMETGGMKGRRKEMTRAEVHAILTEAFGCSTIHSEYGMTEMLSQCYAQSEGVFQSPPWVKILLREVNDPFNMDVSLRSGGINVIDLANIETCCFIETKDIGLSRGEGKFEVLGRFDNSDIRGCNLLVAQ
jgi:phenylacetate-coenzyme A ligase PaaK-like adenylate-forming protein